MNPLQRRIVERIRASGPLPFAAYMQMALYDSTYGYYASGARRTGWRGHFITSPELDPSFGSLWAEGFTQVWVGCGSPEHFEIVEIGPGEGAFASAVLDSVAPDFADALTYRLVERTPLVRDRQQQRLAGRDRVLWTESVTEIPHISAGVVFANEVLDNLPIHLIEMRDETVVELCVGEEEGELLFVPRPPSNPELLAYMDRTQMALTEGKRGEITLAAESLIARLSTQLGKGALIFVDYGVTTAEMIERGGTLVAYSAAGADTDVLSDPGQKDITAHANWTSVTDALIRAGLSPYGPTPQRDVLHALGSGKLEDGLKISYNHAIAEGRGADAVGALSRRQALGALLDPGGLGGLDVMAGLTRDDDGFKFVERLDFLD